MTIDELNAGDVFARENGISLTGDGVAEMIVAERHLNGAGVCQGGAIFTLADLSQASITQGLALTTGVDAHYVHSAQCGDRLIAKSTILHDGRLPLVQTEVKTAEDVLVAVMIGTLYRLKC